MPDFVEKTITNISALGSVIGEENVKDVQKRIADLIVESVRRDIEDSRRYEYSFYPPSYIEGIAEEAFEEVEKKIKKMYKDGFLEAATTAAEKYKEMIIGDKEKK